MRGTQHTMLNRLATLAAVCLLVPIGAAPFASAEPEPPPPAVPFGDAGPPPDNGLVPSSPAAVLVNPEGRTLTVTAFDEFQLPVAPLTTSLASREFVVGGTFNGKVTGSGGAELTGAKLEVGYQIGCGIDAGDIRLRIQAGITPIIAATGPSVQFPVNGRVEVYLQGGTVINVSMDKKEVKGPEAGVKIGGNNVKVDGCVGQSFLRSFATLTSSTADTDDVVTYYGVTKIF